MCPILIYCADKNRAFVEVAQAHGFMLGAQLPCTVYADSLYFADQNWKRPDRGAYMAALEVYRPTMATVLDLERPDQLPDVLSWAEEAAQWAKHVQIIPKVHGIIKRLPRSIGGATVVLGYSVPTKHGGTPVWPGEFAGWPVHLLGGSPQAQMRHYARLRGIADVISVDGNMANKMATTWCAYWTAAQSKHPKDRYWDRIEAGHEGQAPLEAFRRSCENIMKAWREQESYGRTH